VICLDTNAVIAAMNPYPSSVREAGNIRGALERAGTPIGPYDVLIAAQARRRGATLVTANAREVRARAGTAVGGLGGVSA
jgi:predicted nucleic acid-binding protein